MAYAQETVHTIYKKLLRLYPREFRERLGESMEQTFNDLYKERQTASRWPGFVLWIFIETALGIFREHVLFIVEGVAMKDLFANPRSAAVVSSLLYLPAAIFTLLGFFGVSEEIWVFAIPPEIVLLVVILLIPAALLISRAPIKVPAITGFLLVLPLLILELATRSNLPRSNAGMGLFVYLWLLATISFSILIALVRNLRVAKDIMANSVLLLPRVVVLIALGGEWLRWVIDQMPCFLGATGC
jgi:hypothetical protein